MTQPEHQNLLLKDYLLYLLKYTKLNTKLCSWTAIFKSYTQEFNISSRLKITGLTASRKIGPHTCISVGSRTNKRQEDELTCWAKPA